MTNAGSIIGVYGIAIATVLVYAGWIINRGRSIGRELGIGSRGDTTTSDQHDGNEADPWT